MKKILSAAVAVASVVAFAGCSAGDADPSDTTIVLGQWNAGTIATTSLTSRYLVENADLLAEHDIAIEYKEYTNLQALYTDLSRGRVDAVVGGPESFASSAVQGAPIRLAGSFARSNAAVLSQGAELTTDNLRGRRMVAPSTTGTWSNVRLQILDKTGLDADKDYQVVNGDSSSTAIQQLAAGTADFAMGWGESLFEAKQRFPNVKIVADADELANGKKPFIQFVVAVNGERVDPAVSDRLMDAYAEQADWMLAHADQVNERAVQGGRAPGVVKELLESGAINFDVKAFPGPEADELKATLQAMVDEGVITEMPGDEFFGMEG